MNSPLLDLLRRADDLQQLAAERMHRTLHGPPLTPAEHRAYWHARLNLALRAHIAWTGAPR